MPLSIKELHKITKEESSDRKRIGDRITELIKKPHEVLPLLDLVLPYLSREYISAQIRRTLGEEQSQAYLRYLDKIRRFVPDEELRTLLLKLHEESPWIVYTNKDNISRLFPNEFFRRLLDQGVDIFSSPALLKLFQLFNASDPLTSYDEKMQKGIRGLIELDETPDIKVLEEKDPGFACGGMEKNYRVAAEQKTGLCLVNGLFLAKKFHSKGSEKATKVSLLPRDTFKTREEVVVWKNFFYAPGNGTYKPIDKAISDRKKEIEIPNLEIRPIRPTIELESKEIMDKFQNQQ